MSERSLRLIWHSRGVLQAYAGVGTVALGITTSIAGTDNEHSHDIRIFSACKHTGWMEGPENRVKEATNKEMMARNAAARRSKMLLIWPYIRKLKAAIVECLIRPRLDAGKILKWHFHPNRSQRTWMRELHAMIWWRKMLLNWPYIRKHGVTVHMCSSAPPTVWWRMLTYAVVWRGAAGSWPSPWVLYNKSSGLGIWLFQNQKSAHLKVFIV